MPSGYLVSLGTNNTLDEIDAISGGWTSFTTAQSLGAGEWLWTGSYGGRPYTNESEPGQYYLATNGNVYFVPDYGAVATLTEGSVLSAPNFALNDGIVEGTDDGDLIDASYTDIDGTTPGAGNDSIRAGNGDDTIDAGGGADTIAGNGGSDQISGGGGNDVIYGDSPTTVAATNEMLSWDSVVNDEVDVSAGFTRSTGVIDVTMTTQNDGNNNPQWSIESTDSVYSAAGEPFGARSSLYIYGDGDGPTSTTTLSFSADNRAYTGAVSNVRFRLNDFDWGNNNHRDIVTVNAYLDGVPVAVTITPSGAQTVSGNTVTSGNTGTSQSAQNGSVLFEIAGPVDEIEIIYSNGLNGTQAIWMSDVAFTSIPAVDGDDTIDGGAGNDTIQGNGGDDVLAGGTGADNVSGGAGNDTITVAQGDTVTGGDGDDLFILADLGEAGSGNITITGGETGEGAGDTLDLARVAPLSSVVITNPVDLLGGLSGYAIAGDGSFVYFTEIENIICFTPGTLILTETGERPVETLVPGDRVVTRDSGLQPLRWRGISRAQGLGRHAPVHIPAGDRFGLRRPLLVSPQHRMLLSGWQAELSFGASEVLVAAKHLVEGGQARVAECDLVAYVHLAFDRHEVIYAEGAPTESFHPGGEGMAAISPRARSAFFAAFPELGGETAAYGPTARPVARGFEALALTG
ncbi:type I secretion protein [Rhodobacterales bacterium HKCCE2091]|nr:type I secretion protein [Rhodobacterales bacterium HKCCE2091]